MAYFELYVTKHGSASDVNGGSGAAGPKYTLTGGAGAGATATDNGADSNIEDLNNGSWSGVIIGDLLCFDTGGAKEAAKVTAIGVGGDDDIITVTPQLTAAADKSCNVGGAWAGPKRGLDVMQANLAWFSDGTPPCLNIGGGTYTLAATMVWTASGTAKKPIVIAGFDTSVRDKPSTPPVIQYGGHVFDLANYNYLVLLDIHGKQTAAAANVTLDGGGSNYFFLQRCIMEDIAGSGRLIHSIGPSGIVLDCSFRKTGTASGTLANNGYMDVIHYNCLFEGGPLNDYMGTFINCRFKKAEFDINVRAVLVDCLLESDGGSTDLFLIDQPVAQIFVMRNCILKDVPAGKYAVTSDAADFCMFFGDHNGWWNNDGDRNNVNNYDGTGDKTSDPDLDGNDRTQAADYKGTGLPQYADIGALQHEDAGGAALGAWEAGAWR